MEHKTIEQITHVLRASGFTRIEVRESTASTTISAAKANITAVIHFADTEAPPPVRSTAVGTAPEAAIKALVPGTGQRSGPGS